jgi:hypothetical protein
MHLCPTVDQTDGAVEDELAGFGIFTIKRKVAIAHKLEYLTNLCIR